MYNHTFFAGQSCHNQPRMIKLVISKHYSVKSYFIYRTLSNSTLLPLSPLFFPFPLFFPLKNTVDLIVMVKAQNLHSDLLFLQIYKSSKYVINTTSHFKICSYLCISFHESSQIYYKLENAYCLLFFNCSNIIILNLYIVYPPFRM